MRCCWGGLRKEMLMESNGEIVPVSALEHYSYCQRQCALIHVERIFDENVFSFDIAELP